ncbi:hypothetical protein Bca52824_052641 [Brassica carinata]|uniref:Ubiquitin-like protease family profile domain-containing protein n=1 Tax=Brassica carinata TaxID=52824 RepID=A0A8X7UMH6_BRACI|nr:hypothetical protein Bca52824_052641 [Brassica carinata]
MGNVPQGGVDSGMQSGDRRGQPSKQPGHEPQNVPLDIPTLLRMAADAYEEMVMTMFEGYVLSLKGHFNREVGVLRTDLQSATTSIRQLETSVTTEFENIKKLIKGPGYNDEEPPIGGRSPYRQYSPYRGPNHDVRDAFVPPAKDGFCVVNQLVLFHMDRLTILYESQESAAVYVDSHGGPSGDKDAESMGPVPSNVEPSPAQSTGRKDHVETIFVGSETHGSDPVEEPSELGIENNDEVDGSSNPSPSKFKVLGVGDVPAADDAAGDGAIRRFSPSEPTVRKEATKKFTKNVLGNKHASKLAKKNAPASSNPTPPPGCFPSLLGGFNAFAPPTPANRDTFLKRLYAAKSVDVSSGSGYSISSLGPLFHCNGVCSHEALDRVVTFIRNIHDRLPSARFEFVLPSFFLELMRNYAGLDAIKEKHTFVFSTPIKPQFMHHPGWYTHVDFVYSPFLIKKNHWVGLIVDLKMSAMYVVDSNSACPSTVDVTSYLTPISTMLPNLISRYCLVPDPGEMNFRPFPISRIEVPVLLEHPGFLGVAALILLEMVAADQPLNTLSLTEEEVRVATENYAIAAFSMG